MLSPNTAAHTPIARARSRWSGIASTTIASATGLSIEAPTPCAARAATRTGTEGAAEHTSEASPKTTSPSWKMRRRPRRSPKAPEVIKKLAKTMV
jgi:hypothetical protein